MKELLRVMLRHEVLAAGVVDERCDELKQLLP